jgi:hypothetical protein
MQGSLRARNAIAVCGILVAAACVTGGAPPARAAGLGASPAARSYSTPGTLVDVAAASPASAWAIGNAGSTPIVLHWNGTKWSRMAIPHVRHAWLNAVAAVSASDAWITGLDEDPVTESNPSDVLVLHWNGRTWSRVQNPLFDGGDLPRDVAATATSVWIFCDSQIWHLAGRTWSLLPASMPVNGSTAGKVAVNWPETFWRGGTYQPATGPTTAFVVRWNGIAWKRVAIPMDAPGDNILAMAGGPHGRVLAVGYEEPDGSGYQFAASMVWDGKKWRRVPLDYPPSFFEGVGFVPGGTAWAVGSVGSGNTALIARWTGSTWQQLPVTLPALGNLSAVAATSVHDAWAVGYLLFLSSAKYVTLILHWNGKTWS